MTSVLTKAGNFTSGRRPVRVTLALVSLAGLVAGCSTALARDNSTDPAGATASLEPGPLPTLMPTPTSMVFRSSAGETIMLTPPTPTPWSTPTPWPTPAAWQPVPAPLPTLAPLPLTPTAAAVSWGSSPVSYSPPDGVDVFGNTILRWTYYGELAADEYFDIRIKPLGSNDSAFVDWTKSTEYDLRPWSGWQPGVYTWEVGIIKGERAGESKIFLGDTGRASQPFIIKWQGAGGSSGGGGGTGGASGGGGGGSASGGS